MVYTFEVTTNEPSFVNITEHLQQAAAQSNLSTGLCVVTISDPEAALAFVEGANTKAQADILNELNITIPPRVDYLRGGDPHSSAARTKSALLVGAKEIPVVDGKLGLAEGRDVCVVDFLGSKTITVHIKFFSR